MALYDDPLAWAKSQKIVLPDEYYNVLTPAQRNMHWSAAGLARLDLLKGLHKSCIDAVENGETMKQWMDKLLADKDMAGLNLPAHRLDNIFRTNVQIAYTRGIAKQQERPQAVRRRPIFQYDAINDSRTRPTHMAMDNYMARWDDPVWQQWTPTCGYRCRCTRVALTEAEAKARGWDGTPKPAEDATDNFLHPRMADEVFERLVQKAIEDAPRQLGMAFSDSRALFKAQLLTEALTVPVDVQNAIDNAAQATAATPQPPLDSENQ